MKNKQKKVQSNTPKYDPAVNPLVNKVTPVIPAAKAISDTKSSKNQGIILINQSAMQTIYENSGPLASANEYQVHYWFLNYRFKAADGSLLDIAIPTTYFNYEQFVSGARIDFEMADVSAMSAKVQPIHNMKMNQIQATFFKSNIESIFGVTFEEMSVDVGSIHKHPGGSSHQAFSGTDLDTKAAEHGVVYPLLSAEDNKPNFAGIMAIDQGKCNVAHYEYRVANGTLGTDLSYVQGRCEAIIIQDSQTTSDIEKLMGIGQVDYKIKAKNSALSQQALDSLVIAYKEIEFVPFTDTIRPENVKKVAYTAPVRYGHQTQTQFKFPAAEVIDPTVVILPTKLSDKVLLGLTLVEKINYLFKVDKAYYGDHINIEDYAIMTEAEVFGNIEDTWELLEEESNDLPGTVVPNTMGTMPLTREEKIRDLVAWGVTLTTLITAPNAQIDAWHKNAL